MPTNSVSTETIRELMEVPGPCVTVVSKSGADLTRSLNSLRRSMKSGSGLPAAAEGLLDAIPKAVAELPNGAGAARQVAVFSSATTLAACHVSDSVQPMARVGERFDLRTLLAAACAQRNFFILALSQNRTRLLQCTHDHSEEVSLPEGTPLSFDDSRQTRKPDHVLDNMATGGPSVGSMKGVMSGTSTDREDKDEFLLHFFRELDRAVNAVLKNSNAPLIVAGVEHEIALYRRVNTYKPMVEPGVHGAPDGLEGGEMHRRALELLREDSHDPAFEPLRDFDKRVGTGHASVHIQEIVAAAFEGRVSHLFFQSGAQYLGTFDPVRQRVKHTQDPLDNPSDLIESAAEQTLRHGGEARVANASAMPSGVPVCAIFRYAAPQQAAPAVEAA